MGRSGPSFVLADAGVQAVEWTRAERNSVPRPRGRRGQGPPLVGLPVLRSALDLGTIDCDGWGTVLVASDTLALNASWSPAEIADELASTTGISRVVWLPHLLGDPEEGHGFAPAVFASPGVVLVHDQQNIGHPDNETTIETVARLGRCFDSVGRKLKIIRVPAPARLRDDDTWLHWTYLGFGLIDGAVIVPVFDDPNDNRAMDVLATAFPGRHLIGVDARPLFRAGHAIGCLMRGQPQPR